MAEALDFDYVRSSPDGLRARQADAGIPDSIDGRRKQPVGRRPVARYGVAANDLQSQLARHRITHPWTLYDVFLVLLEVLFTVLFGGCILVSARIALLHSAQQIDAERH